MIRKPRWQEIDEPAGSLTVTQHQMGRGTPQDHRQTPGTFRGGRTPREYSSVRVKGLLTVGSEERCQRSALTTVGGHLESRSGLSCIPEPLDSVWQCHEDLLDSRTLLVVEPGGLVAVTYYPMNLTTVQR